MGSFLSNLSDYITWNDGPTLRKPATKTASPEADISTAGSYELRLTLPGPEINVFGSDGRVLFPTGTDITQFESSRQTTGWAETMPIRPPAARGPKCEIVDTPHRSIPRARTHAVVHGFKNSSPETPGGTPSRPPPSSQRRQRSVTAPPGEALEPKRHSWVKQSAPGGSLPAATGPDIKVSYLSNNSTLQIRARLEIDELRDGLSSETGKRSKRLDALDCTSQLKGRTKPKFTGRFSDVSQAKLGNRVVAVKALRVGNMEGVKSRILKRLAREIYVWSALDHPNVLELLGLDFGDVIPSLISPWCDNGTLQEYLQKFPDANRRRLVREIAEGLRYLHEQTPPILHGDLKTTNVFVTGDYVAKISDFGTSRHVEELRTGFTTDGLALATIRYTAPEILLDGQKYTLRSDVFSFACVALETMTNKCPFWKIENAVQVINKVVFQRQTPSPEDHPGMEEAIWELLRKCWNHKPSDRPEMLDVCQMAFHYILSVHTWEAFLQLLSVHPEGIKCLKPYDVTGWLLRHT